MPPKPFNPPRPTTASASSTSKPKGRPKGSTNKTTSTPSAITKRKSTTSNIKGKENGKRMSGERARLSAASVRSLLPSLSPDSDEVDGEEGDSDPFDSPQQSASKPRSRPRIPNPDLDLGLEEDEQGGEGERDRGRKERISDDLLSVILHELFKEGTRMSRDANRAVGRYMDTFVREGVARAAWAGEEDGTGRGGGGVLEVEDLERLAPQLLLDF